MSVNERAQVSWSSYFGGDSFDNPGYLLLSEGILLSIHPLKTYQIMQRKGRMSSGSCTAFTLHTMTPTMIPCSVSMRIDLVLIPGTQIPIGTELQIM